MFAILGQIYGLNRKSTWKVSLKWYFIHQEKYSLLLKESVDLQTTGHVDDLCCSDSVRVLFANICTIPYIWVWMSKFSIENDVQTSNMDVLDSIDTQITQILQRKWTYKWQS